MKADEIAKYLPYANKNQDYKIITAEQYTALINIACKYGRIYNEIRTGRTETNAEISIIKTMMMIEDDCLANI